MLKSIQWKVLTLFILLTVSVMTFVGAFSAWGISSYYHRQFVEDMKENTFTQSMTEQLKKAAEMSFSEFTDILGKHSVRIGIDSYRDAYVLDGTSGKSLYTLSGKELDSDYEMTENVLSAMAGKTGDKVDRYAKIMDYAVPVEVDGSVRYVVYVTDSKVEMYEVMKSILGKILLSLLIGVCISVILGFVLSRAIIAPLKKLQSSAAHMAEGNFSDKIKVISEDEIGSLTHAFNYMADELSATMSEMTAEKNKVETVLLYMTDGVVAFNAEGKLIHINPAATKILEIKEDEIKDFDSFYESLGTDINIGQFLYLAPDTVERSIDLGEKHLMVCLAPLVSDGHVDGVVSVFRDFTKQQKLDNARREFVANVSHELRTPITVIKSYAETLMEYREHDETEAHFLEVIDSESDRMTRLIKDLLALSKLDSNLELKKAPFSLPRLVSSVCERLSMELKAHNQTLERDISESVPEISGDRDRIEQVIINIITNAAKYTKDGGKIEVFCNCDSQYAYVKISDNGIGIPKEDLPRIFERFYRVDKARSRSKGGTGLGLAIAKEIIDAHGGSIKIDSEEGKGTTVTVALLL